MKFLLFISLLIYVIGILYFVLTPSNENRIMGNVERIFFSLGYTVALLTWPIVLICSIIINKEEK